MIHTSDRDTMVALDGTPGCAQGFNTLSPKHRELSLVLCDDLDGWDGEGQGWEGGPRGKEYMNTYS